MISPEPEDDELLLEFADKNDVAGDSAARTGKLFAVARPVEPEDLIGHELSQLFRLTTCE